MIGGERRRHPRVPVAAKRVTVHLRDVDGRELGVEAMALYYYFPSKDALLDNLVGLLTEQVALPSPVPTHWTDAARQISRSYREVAHAHPNAFRLLASRPLGTPRETAAQRAAFDLLIDAGFDDEAAPLAYRALANYALGSALEELTARAPDVTKADPDGAFEFGLDVVLAGLETKLAEAQRRKGPTG